MAIFCEYLQMESSFRISQEQLNALTVKNAELQVKAAEFCHLERRLRLQDVTYLYFF